MELLAGAVVADRFRLERELGKGGMGAVWLAHHTGLDMPCAIKFILAQAAQTPELRARFEREARAAAHIKSPHVVQILDYGTCGDMPFLAMEYLEGEDLAARLARRGTLSPRETATIIGQVARALGKAHTMGIVHRDIKPSNIFLVRDEDQEIAKVVDFGIAKSHALATGQGQTRTGALLGTPCYMSPEQAQGTRTVDHRSDLWALGVVAFQCLTGRLPFLSDAFGDLLLKIMVEPLPVPSQIARVPPGFDAWFARAVARDPAARFQSARELAEGLYLALGISGVDELREIAQASTSTPPPPPATVDSLGPTAFHAATAPTTPSSPPPTPGGATLRLGAAPARRARGRPVVIAASIAASVVMAGLVVLLVLVRPRARPTVAPDTAPTSAAAVPPPPTVTPAPSTAPPPAETSAPPPTAEPSAAVPEDAGRAEPPLVTRPEVRRPGQCKAAGRRCLSNDDCCDRTCRAWTCRANPALHDPYAEPESQ